MNILEMFKKAKAVYQRGRVKPDAAQMRLEDLTKKYHTVGGVQLPDPTLFALNWLEKRFGDLERISLTNLDHLGAVVFILRHQNDSDMVQRLTPQQVADRIAQTLSGIAAHTQPHYVACIAEIFAALKKNYAQQAEEMLQMALVRLATNQENTEA